jgi:hypothetical protein
MYSIKLMFEWGGGCLWYDNDEAREEFDVGDIENKLPLSDEIRSKLLELSSWHDNALDWDNPGGQGLWSDDEEKRFSIATNYLLEKIRKELGPEFKVTYVEI